MRNVFISMSVVALMAAMTACTSTDRQQKAAMDEPFRQEREFMNKAIKDRSPDVQKVDIIGNTVVYTHIFDGIIDVKTYTYDSDVCVEAERVFAFPNQMSALRHYRRAVEQADLYDDIQMFKNEVKYDLKKEQYEMETKGLTKEQLKAKFEKQIADAKADMNNMKHRHDKSCCK